MRVWIPRAALMLLAAACTPPGEGATPADSGVDAGDPDGDASDGSDGSDGSEGSDGSDGSDGPALCAPGMVPVPADAPVFCIDAYEGTADGDGAASVSGALPLVGESFDAARARCSATAVVDADGAVVGTKRLASLDEWRDAADGVLGDGGQVFPTGETWPGDACVVPDPTGDPIVDGLQPTGAFPDCVGPFGTFDQLGNAWEWADPGLSIDLDAFVAARADEGLVLSLDALGGAHIAAGEATDLALEIAGLQGRVGVQDGLLVATDVHFQAAEPFEYAGFVIARSGESEVSADWLLPARVAREGGVEDAAVAPLIVMLEEDGAPVTAKVGCAWYTGGEMGCRNTDRYLAHPHTFGGTIALRCAADPLP